MGEGKVTFGLPKVEPYAVGSLFSVQCFIS